MFKAPVGLDNCDHEPIHIPGRIQSHGVLVAFDLAQRVSHRSANAEALLGALAPALGQPLQETCFAADADMLELLQECFAAEAGDVQPAATEVELAGQTFEMIGHRVGDTVLAELELLAPDAAGFADDAFKGHRALTRIKRQRTVDDLLAAAAQEVRTLTGFDRVMAYRFRHDDSGDVVVEAKADALEPLAGRRYPAGDIPAQARRLYTLNTLRIIVAVGSASVPVEARADAAAMPLDMSHSVLRAVSPVHIEYLTNMGVQASMSISIVVHGKLWGMLACHHMSPRHVPYRVRSACDVLAHILAANVQSALARASAHRLEAAASVRARAIEDVLHADDGVFALLPAAEALYGMFEAHGLVLAEQGRIASVGVPAEAARELVPWLQAQPQAASGLYSRASLAGLPPGLQDALGIWCGFLALRFSSATAGWLVLLRKEQVETIAWGGKPDKHYDHGPMGPRLTPRGSFDVWKETVRGQCVPWSETDLEIAHALVADLMRASVARNAELDRARSHLLSMLSAGMGTPEQLQAASVQQAGGRMQRFVAQVLDAALLQKGEGLALNVQPVDLGQLLHRMLDEEAAAHPALRFVREIPRALPFAGDVARLRQLLACLIGNARRHGAPDESVVVQLQQQGDLVVLEISNVGAEVEPVAADVMFDPFRATPTGIRATADGLGLGLYIARHIARAHGGDLEYAYADPYVLFTLTLRAEPGAAT
ncbi:GAF domain-containing protein [Pseudorhodoferax sp. Leaf267]|uniref:GAF domain-containing protein n=1 Tax=Pseudorhodoferax sp. Leaf267 TaxID=1736316 RepID=UPI00138EFD42|nr:GAF domain-containing protein [Pseudorhodoferax sp. Leaf267]